MENYAAIKERLVAQADTAAIGVDDEYCAAIAARRLASGRRIVRISVEHAVQDGFMAEGSTILRVDEAGAKPIADLSGIGSLRGAHNAQNAAAAIAVATALGVSFERIQDALRTVPGSRSPHGAGGASRLGAVRERLQGHQRDSTEKALSSFERILWILGGKAKEGGISTLASYFPRIEKAYLIGDATEDFARVLEGKVPYVRCGTLDKAVELAAADAVSSQAAEPVVLLSPACASFDQYPNFERRGDHFRDLVRALPGIQLVKGV
jgi:UDP-N-acetylmuramoylalanine--D-glutamate ligase